jgi:fengycin family lipopeptide synthetase D/gramicidin S synthase 1/tyrocidine synthetase-1/tyrocidine synthetase-2
LPDGNILFLGRIDSQVNIKGYRVELDEIKCQILKHKDLQDAAVIVNDGDLCAYFVVKETQKYNRTNVQHSETKIDGSELRNYLSKTLPDYMVPLYFIKIDEIPLTPNGKLDRESLPDPKRISGTEYTAPRNEIEEKLEEIWSGVLGLEKIGIKDNFFILGGDSIKTIQISARMRKYGYRIEMRDIFRNPTIMDLASLVKKDTKISEQSVVTGVVKLTPIQRCFFEDNNIDKHHYNQSVMFHSKERFSKEALQTIFTKIHEHHDSLRMRYIEENGEIKQINEGLDYPLSFDEYDLRDQKEPIEELEKKANEIQGSINLEKGPLMKVGLFHLVDGDRLLIVIHHLVIDGVSWRILFEDIETLYNQYKKREKLDLPLKTDSFKLWSEKLSEYSNSELFLEEKSYWLGIDSNEVPEIKRDFKVEGNYIKDTESITFRLSKKETNELLTRVNELFGTEINDILLTGLGIGIREIFGNENVLIAMEGHGREEIIKGIDISRTVGWFTSEYPVILDMSYRGDLSRQIKEVKESLHQVPEKGIGYGILKYLTSESNKPEFEFELDPQIGFNYLGQFDTDVNRSSFEIAKESSGNGASINRERDFEIDIAGMISDGQLGISINYNKNHYKPETIRRLIDHFKEGLRNIISYCTEDRSKELTPSDFGIKELSIEEFDSLFDS